MTDSPVIADRRASIRVLHVVRPAAGGIRQHVLQLIEWSDRRQFPASLAAPADFLRDLPPTVEATGRFPLDIAPRLSPLRDLRAARHLARLASAHADLVHAHGLRAAWLTALAHRGRVPFVVTAHNLVPDGALTRRALGMIAARAVRIIAITQAVAEGLALGGVPREKITVIPNGVNLDYFAALPAPGQARRSLDLSPGKFVVGCVARLSPEKGVDVLLQAAVRQPGMAFLIAGDGPEHAVLSRDLPSNARLLGRIADTRTLLAAADAVAIPSREEGQGIVALEAAAAGVPVVASRVGGLAEMLTDGRTALLVSPEDPAALGAALALLRDDPELGDQLARSARALAESRYDIRRQVGAVERLYESVTGGQMPPG